VVDWAISVAIFVALAHGLSSATGNPMMWWLVAAGGFTSALHAIVFDYIQQEYICNVRGNRNFLSKELERVRAELEGRRAHGGGWWSRLWLEVYLRYLTVQAKSQFKENGEQQAPPQLFREYNSRLMRWWTVLGATTNRTGLIVAALLGRPDLFCWIVFIPGNLYLLSMVLIQRRTQRRLEQKLRLGPYSEQVISL
ncbi:MAG TPA: hypothetical protein VF889_03245, partial [Bacteroidota bacterium]